MFIPKKLSHGSTIRVIAPSTSGTILSQETIETAIAVLEGLGYLVTFGRYVFSDCKEISECRKEKLADLHDAFLDTSVDCILTAIGGRNANELLLYIDYEIIKNNPKIFCGYSDISVLLNAITTTTGLVTYSGPHFSTFGMKKGGAYSVAWFQKILGSDKGVSPVEYYDADQRSDDKWYLEQDKRTFFNNDGIKIIQTGEAKGQIRGGNLCTCNLLLGGPYMADISGCILFLEEISLAGDMTLVDFRRNLISLLQQASGKINGIVCGRFQQASAIAVESLGDLFSGIPEIEDIPIIANASFGHTMPMITFPIGGMCVLDTSAVSPIIFT